MTPVTITGQYGDDTFIGHVDGNLVRVAGNGTTAHLAGIVRAIDATPKDRRAPNGDTIRERKALVELTAFVPEADITYLRTHAKGRRS